MTLYPLDIVNGTFSLVFVAISIMVGLIILSRYFRYREKVYFYVGTTWLFISSSWWSSSVSFIVALINGSGIPEWLYFLIGNVFTPFAIILWLIAFTEFLYTEKRKLILLIFSIYGLIFEIVFFILLFIDPSQIGMLTPPVDVRYESFILVYLISFLIIVIFSGILFARLSLKSDDLEVKLKGKLLIMAYIFFAVGAVLDSSIPLNEITIVITRLILIISAILWYGGFLLPKWMKKLLLKSK
ncbi:MAG: hypothetical protein ACFFBV_04510 [Promethearchaeota archaeon]